MMISYEVFAEITAPDFCARIVLERDVVTKADPDVKFMIGWTRGEVRSYCQGKQWKAVAINTKMKRGHSAT